MKMTFMYRQAMVNNEAKSSDVFLVFPRFLDTPGLIEQDFRFLFGEATANKFLEKWPATFKAKVIKESHELVPTTELLDLIRNAESAAEVENGWDSDMSAILLLLHLLPPSALGRKRPAGKAFCVSSCRSAHQISKGWNHCAAASRQHYPKQSALPSRPGIHTEHHSLWLTSMHFHARQQVQLELLTNALKPITSLVRHTVLP
ncbi:uncharacterized protein LOC132858333 [Tachysurus vachellii]|uniref:uncharacterized protein LOC132858333 n=1 Tax=Tachysurus vachellii TaxID=175792 RepID=UPI00296AD87B|nr:uncharacterized protein LOC132858333 [Tachysurus vachellii]